MSTDFLFDHDFEEWNDMPPEKSDPGNPDPFSPPGKGCDRSVESEYGEYIVLPESHLDNEPGARPEEDEEKPPGARDEIVDPEQPSGDVPLGPPAPRHKKRRGLAIASALLAAVVCGTIVGIANQQPSRTCLSQMTGPAFQ